MDISYKKMSEADFSKCVPLFMSTFEVEPWNEKWTYEQAYSRIDEVMSSKTSFGYIACEGDTFIGMLCGRFVTYLAEKELWIDEFCIQPEYQRKGIGRQMLEFIKESLRMENIHCMVLNTERDYECMKFYKKNGFSEYPSLVFMVNNFE